MSLADELAQAAEDSRRIRCTVALILQDLDPADRGALEAAMLDGTLTGRVIAEVLTRRGHKVGSGAILNHRNKRCSCQG